VARARAAMGVTVVFDPFVEQEFRRFAGQLETDPLMVLLARMRREAAIDALKSQPGVDEVIPSGSLARGTHLGRIHDVDLIVVFDQDAHPEWRGPGSADVALEHVQGMVADSLQGGLFSMVHDTEKRNHVVKANLDPSWGPFLDALVPIAPPIDIMPAIRVGSHLRVPERLNRDLSDEPWVEVDPEKLMRMVAARRREWSNFDKVVRLVKVWADDRKLGLSRLAVEVMVLKYLPRPSLFETLSCSDAIAEFFREAADHIVDDKIIDPAGRCGEIVPGLNYDSLQEALAESAKLAEVAVAAERAWEGRHYSVEGVTHPSVFWQEIFGKENIRRPRVWYYSPRFPEMRPDPESRHWFDEHAEPADETWSWAGHMSANRFWSEPGPETPDEAAREGPEPVHEGSRIVPEAREPDEAAEPPGEAAVTDSLGDVLTERTQETPVSPSVFGAC
jgi:predicted nucleotidyltransferase